MDPDACLEQIRSIVELFQSGDPWGYSNEVEDAGYALATLVDALDGWVVSGGVLPLRWQT